MPSTDLIPTSVQTDSAHLPACGPSETPESLDNSDQAPRSLFGVSEKCREGRQEDRMLWLKSGVFFFADANALNKPSGVC